MPTGTVQHEPSGFAWLTAHLPFGLSSVVAPTALGYALINSATFGLDVTMLWLLHGVAGWPLPAGITVSYLTAFAVSFVHNRRFNFRSSAPVGPQVGVYLVVLVVNFLVFVLGVADGLARVGVDYRLSRLAAGACEAVFLYIALRRVVFRDRRGGSA